MTLRKPKAGATMQWRRVLDPFDKGGHLLGEIGRKPVRKGKSNNFHRRSRRVTTRQTLSEGDLH